MKRTPLKRKTPLKSKAWSTELKTKVKKRKQSISFLKKKLWKVFSQYIRTRDKFTCFTCGRKGEGGGMHAGHFISKSVGGIGLYFHEDNVHAQCYNCNINLSGNQWEYGQRLGAEKVAELMKIKQEVNKWSEDDYREKIDIYEWKLSRLSTGK